MAIARRALGPDHPDVATTLNNLAVLSTSQGRYAEAEPLYKRALAIDEKALGPDHPDVAQPQQPGRAVRSQGRYAEAEPLYKRALAIREKALGPDHPDVATSLNNLAALYQAQGRYAEAEPLYKRALGDPREGARPRPPRCRHRRSTTWPGCTKPRAATPRPSRSTSAALAICEKALGPDHPDVATALNNLAVLYRAQGRYAEAEPLYKRSLAIREKALGPDHPDVAQSLNNLAELYRPRAATPRPSRSTSAASPSARRRSAPTTPMSHSAQQPGRAVPAQGRYAEAEPLYKRSLAIPRRRWAPTTPTSPPSLNNLAVLYQAQGRYAEAEPLCKRGFAIYEKALGPDHPDVGTALNNLAGLYDAQGRYAEAERLFKRTLSIDEKALGPDHPNVGYGAQQPGRALLRAKRLGSCR